VKVPRVTLQVELQLRRRSEMSLFQRLGDPLQSSLEEARLRRAPGAQRPPFANGGGVGDDAGKPDVGPGELCAEMVEPPEVAGQQVQFGLNVG